ncbi:MAG: hypothetical protein ACRD6W_17670, partial [Nitrososphaerales archaeon]
MLDRLRSTRASMPAGGGTFALPHWPMAVVLRVLVVMGLFAIATVHLNLYVGESYDRIPTIGWLFLLTVVTAFVFAVALALRPHPLLALATASFAMSVLGGYLLTLFLPGGLFSFKEPG